MTDLLTVLHIECVAPETWDAVESDSVPRIIISVTKCLLSYAGGGKFGGQLD